jgi:hypothetical protein
MPSAFVVTLVFSAFSLQPSGYYLFHFSKLKASFAILPL